MLSARAVSFGMKHGLRVHTTEPQSGKRRKKMKNWKKKLFSEKQNLKTHFVVFNL